MQNSSQQLNKPTAIIILVVIVGIILAGGVLLLKNDKSDNQLVNKFKKIIDNHLVYSVEEYLDENSFITVFYSYDLSTGETNKLFQLDKFKDSFLGKTEVADDGIFFVSDRRGDMGDIFKYDFNGQKLLEIDTGEAVVYEYIVNKDASLIAYQEIVSSRSDGPEMWISVFNVKIFNDDGNLLSTIPSNSFEFNSEKMTYINPIIFDENSDLFVLTSPLFGGDIGDQMILYKVDIDLGQKEFILFTGSDEQYNSNLPYEKYVESLKDNILFNRFYPKHDFIIVERDLSMPYEIIKYDLSTKEFISLFDPSVIDNEADLSAETENLSPNGNLLIINRCGFIEASGWCEGRNKGFHILNIDTGKLERDFKISGEFVAWISDNKIIYKDYRGEAWDDIYHTLKIVNIDTSEEIEVYTQVTDRPVGPGYTKKGDGIYNYRGLVIK